MNKITEGISHPTAACIARVHPAAEELATLAPLIVHVLVSKMAGAFP